MRIAVVDIGTNSTRLLIAEVENARVRELERRTEITRLGEGVDRSGRLLDAAMERVLATCAQYREAIEGFGVERTVAVMTSAVRDAVNGAELADALGERLGFDAETISGDREAQLTYMGATSGRGHRDPILVLDIGGGSTELVVGEGERIGFHVSTQIGSVRQTERNLVSDPPTAAELERCRAEIRGGIEEAVPASVRRSVADGIAVAGTPTSFAAIEQRLEPYDPERVDGYRLEARACERILSRLSALPLEQRRRVPGLHPDRAPAIVAGGIILAEAIDLFGLRSIEVSEHDILAGAAIEAAGRER